MTDEVLTVLKDILAWTKNNNQELKAIRQLNSEMTRFMRDAEKEVPESLRRFANYYHDMHDVRFIYEEHGQEVPSHVLRELERLDDRCRQLIKEHSSEGGAINKIIREMASDKDNRWDHTKRLPKPEEKANGS